MSIVTPLLRIKLLMKSLLIQYILISLKCRVSILKIQFYWELKLTDIQSTGHDLSKSTKAVKMNKLGCKK